MPLKKHHQSLEALYERYNRREFVHPDPLEFLYRYDDPLDREVAGLIASSLAFGRVAQILKSVTYVLDRMGESPSRFVYDARPATLEECFGGFVHRIWTGRQLAALLSGMGRAIRRHGSLAACFAAGIDGRAETLLPALQTFVNELRLTAPGRRRSLLPNPAAGSACKRLHLYLRWMVRRDDVDPGGWDAVPAAKLIVPMDTHMHRIARTLGATTRKTADLRAALETTAAFRRVCPDDPVRYDFALTRLGIRREADMNAFFAQCGKAEAERA